MKKDYETINETRKIRRQLRKPVWECFCRHARTDGQVENDATTQGPEGRRRQKLPASADNVALPAFAAACRAVARLLLLLTAGRASIDVLWPPGPQQQTGSSGWMGQTDGRSTVRYGPRSFAVSGPVTLNTLSVTVLSTVFHSIGWKPNLLSELAPSW